MNENNVGGYNSPHKLTLHREKHHAAFIVLEKYRGKVFDGMMRVLLS